MVDTTFPPTDSAARALARPFAQRSAHGKPQSIVLLDTPTKFDCGGACAFGTVGDYVRFGQMLVNGGALDGQRVLSPKTVAHMTSNHLGPEIKNNVGMVEPHRDGFGFGLGVAVRTKAGISAVPGNPGEYTWNGAYGTSSSPTRRSGWWWWSARRRRASCASTIASRCRTSYTARWFGEASPAGRKASWRAAMMIRLTQSILPLLVAMTVASASAFAAAPTSAEKAALNQAIQSCKSEAKGKKVPWLQRRKYVKNCVVEALKDKPQIDVNALLKNHPELRNLPPDKADGT